MAGLGDSPFEVLQRELWRMKARILALVATLLLSVGVAQAQPVGTIDFTKTAPAQGGAVPALTHVPGTDKLFSGSMGQDRIYRYDDDWTQGDDPYDGTIFNSDVLGIVGLASDATSLYQFNIDGGVSQTDLSGNFVENMTYGVAATGGDYYDGKLYLTSSTTIHRGSLAGGVEKSYTVPVTDYMDVGISDIIILGTKCGKLLALLSNEDGGYAEGTLNDVTNSFEILEHGEFNAGGVDDLACKLLSPGDVRCYAGQGGSIGQFEPPIQPDIPEPATLSLICLGALPLLRRKRR